LINYLIDVIQLFDLIIIVIINYAIQILLE